MSRYFPFDALGLRCNPFGALTRDEWASLAILPESLLAALQAGSGYLQVIGERGRGKTTCLLGLAQHFVSAGERVIYERIPEGQRHCETGLTGLDRFLLDEAQRLSPWQRGQLLRAAAGGLRIVLGSHADYTRHFARHRLHLYTVRIADAASPAHLAAILARRLDCFAFDHPPRVGFTPDAVEYLHRTYGTDLRAVENALYHVFQRLAAPGDLTAADLIRFTEEP